MTQAGFRMRTLLAGLTILAAGLFSSGGASAQTLDGQRQFCLTDRTGSYSGIVEFGAKRQVRLVARGPGQNVTEKGHVVADGARVEIVFTSFEAPFGYDLDHFHCQVGSAWTLDCVNKDSAGKVSDPFVLERVEDVPMPLNSNTAFCTRPTT